MRVLQTDVLVVGGGGAGFRAAIGARERGARATLVSKGPLARSGASPMAGADLTVHGQGMRAAGFFGEPRDSEEKFFSDIVHQGCFLNDQRLVEIYVHDGPDRLLETLSWGCKPRFCDERAVFTSGTEIMDAHLREAQRLGVDLLEDTAIVELLVEDGHIVGALGLDIRSGELSTFYAPTVVLATGGWHKAYTPVTGSKELTGDGVAMAYRAGAELGNMEFVTFACNIPFWPPIWRGSIITYVMSMMCGGTLENADGERFLEKYDPEIVSTASMTEWNKSFFSNVAAQEVRAGKGSPHGGVFYVIGDTPWEEFEARAMRSYPGWQFKGVDFSEMGRMLHDGEGVEVGGAAEYFEGGVCVDEHFATRVPGLYAAGECAISLFGANRVAAATMEMLVSGAIAGREAGEHALRATVPEPASSQIAPLVARIEAPLHRRNGSRPAPLRARLQRESYDKLGPVRNGQELEALLAFVDDLRDELTNVSTTSTSRAYNKEWVESLELENMLQVIEISARTALARTESRGVHYREDFPDTDNERWLKEVIVRQKGDVAELDDRPVRITSLTPPDEKIPYLEMVKRMMAAHSDVGGHH
ncbi:FAD-binding protein [bacterium]|nr:FAD-binding protein [bacterium]